MNGSVRALNLPLITPQHLQERFLIKTGCIQMIFRPVFSTIKDMITSHLGEGLYLHGPMGIGKSHILYFLACAFLQEKNYRVTYINNCADWAASPYDFVCTELIMSFHEDIPFVCDRVKAILELNEDIPRKQELCNLISDIGQVLRDKGVQWIFFIDQLNHLYRTDPPLATQRPFVEILRILPHRATVVVSASANNEAFPIKLPDYNIVELTNHPYDEAQFFLWCTLNHYEATNPVMEEVRYHTKLIPLELQQFHYQPGDDATSKLRSYLQERFQALSQQHRTFYKRLNKSDEQLFLRCVIAMMLQVQVDLKSQIIVLDHQLMVNNLGMIRALTPVCFGVILAAHSIPLVDDLNYSIQQILKSESFTNDVKGRTIEVYMIQQMELKRHYSFRKLAPAVTADPKFLKLLEGDFYKSVRFSGKRPPFPDQLAALADRTLFIPEASNHPAIDFAVWDPKLRKLLVVQITVTNPVQGHANYNDGNSEFAEHWAAALGIKKDDILMLWIIPERSFNRVRPQNGLSNGVIFFSALQEQFPTLSKLILKD